MKKSKLQLLKAKNEQVRPMTERQKLDAKKMFEKMAWQTKNGCTCTECGAFFTTKMVRKRCPMCGEKLELETTRKRKRKESAWFVMLQKCGEYQLFRRILVTKEVKKGMPAQYTYQEMIRQFMDETGHVTHFARNKMPCAFYNAYNYETPIKYKAVSDENDTKYNHWWQYKIYSLLPTFKRNGFDNSNVREPIRMIRMLLYLPMAETLYKHKQYTIIKNFSEYDISHYWPELKICLRNNYTATDWQLWRDTIDALKRLGKDTHNAIYVCPKDLKAAHDIWVKLYAREQERRQIKECRQIFDKKRKFFDIVLKQKDITIKPLRTIEEYKKEGDTMHHCVYQMKYYLKKDTLILSAHTQKERLATIELSLDNFEILQCRADHNKIAPREKEIVSLIQRNIKKFQKIKLLNN